MNHIFNGSYREGDLIYDYTGVFVRQTGGISWKAVVMNAGVVCRPSGKLDDGLTHEQILGVIQQLVEISIKDAAAEGDVEARSGATTLRLVTGQDRG